MTDKTDAINTAEYAVTGMSCGHCENAVRQEIGEIGGVEVVEVSADSGRLVVSSPSAPIDDAAVIAAVDEAGYSAVRA